MACARIAADVIGDDGSRGALAEPDKMAEQSVASLGQTVRRQVAAMNDAISRALGRAGELEALVHNEVAALERSYGENENRIRNLI